MKMYKVRSLILPAMMACSAAGCGADTGLVPAGGVVTMNGEPLARANVSFISQVPSNDPTGMSSSSITDAEGKFMLTAMNGNPGAKPGNYKVTVRKVEGEGAGIEEGDSAEDIAKKSMQAMMGGGSASFYVTDPMYSQVTNTPLTAKVTDGANPEDNQFAFEVPPAGG